MPTSPTRSSSARRWSTRGSRKRIHPLTPAPSSPLRGRARYRGQADRESRRSPSSAGLRLLHADMEPHLLRGTSGDEASSGRSFLRATLACASGACKRYRPRPGARIPLAPHIVLDSSARMADESFHKFALLRPKSDVHMSAIHVGRVGLSYFLGFVGVPPQITPVGTYLKCTYARPTLRISQSCFPRRSIRWRASARWYAKPICRFTPRRNPTLSHPSSFLNSMPPRTQSAAAASGQQPARRPQGRPLPRMHRAPGWRRPNSATPSRPGC